ncbi:type II RES/Xre toxin-antitoxin system antitoxin [Foetidibacter luteolus]|uniref:type II RES/Xre toxin-antitoxin system antitoxin n=1 Tax=Foetidibacter luteolus TaxID=2608880 RepID=UPI001A9800AD|nr:antitoxin Xre/MbcA/ParS toxin-binding domain-containing protein [Foetidibacter luteolus]
MNKAEARKKEEDLKLGVQAFVDKHASSELVTWAILGGKEFMPQEPITSLDFVSVSDKGIPKQSVANLAGIMDVPMKDIASLLNLSYKTLGRKKNSDALDSLSSSLSIEIANTIAKGLSVFEDADKLNRWLQKENRSLNGKKPFELLRTPTGIKLVNRLLGRIEEGVYT